MTSNLVYLTYPFQQRRSVGGDGEKGNVPQMVLVFAGLGEMSLGWLMKGAHFPTRLSLEEHQQYTFHEVKVKKHSHGNESVPSEAKK